MDGLNRCTQSKCMQHFPSKSRRARVSQSDFPGPFSLFTAVSHFSRLFSSFWFLGQGNYMLYGIDLYFQGSLKRLAMKIRNPAHPTNNYCRSLARIPSLPHAAMPSPQAVNKPRGGCKTDGRRTDQRCREYQYRKHDRPTVAHARSIDRVVYWPTGVARGAVGEVCKTVDRPFVHMVTTLLADWTLLPLIWGFRHVRYTRRCRIGNWKS